MSKVIPLIGTDPEFFLSEDGNPKSAHGLVPGNKAEPYKLDKGACQLDGVAVEFNIEPASSASEFATNVETVLRQVRQIIPNKYKFLIKPYVQFNMAHWRTIPAEFKALGCDPDYASLHGRVGLQNQVRDPGNLRTGSGHIHLGWTEGADINDIVHQSDALYVAQRLFFWTEPVRYLWDTDTTRHYYYGGQGAFRPKPYGVEYRGLSNAWLKYPDLYEYIYNLHVGIFTNLQDDNSELHKDGYYHILASQASVNKHMKRVLGPDFPDFPKNLTALDM